MQNPDALVLQELQRKAGRTSRGTALSCSLTRRAGILPPRKRRDLGGEERHRTEIYRIPSGTETVAKDQLFPVSSSYRTNNYHPQNSLPNCRTLQGFKGRVDKCFKRSKVTDLKKKKITPRSRNPLN